MRTIAITSGKGGVGKSNIAVNLAITLAKRGNRVCLFDADTGLANISILLGIAPKYTLEHLINGEQRLEDIRIKGPGGIHIIPGASGVADLVDLEQSQQDDLIETLDALEPHYDYLLIDTGAGISPTVLHFVVASQLPMLVITPEPTSLTDAFSLLKVLRRGNFKRQIQVVVNMAPSINRAHDIFKRFQSAVDKYIGLRVRFLGTIWQDPSIAASVKRQHPVALGSPTAPACQDFNLLADNIERTYEAGLIKTIGFSRYWQRRVHKHRLLAEKKAQTKQGSASKTMNTTPHFGDASANIAQKSSPTPVDTETLASAEASFVGGVWASASRQLQDIIKLGKISRGEAQTLIDALSNLVEDLPLEQGQAVVTHGATLEHQGEFKHQGALKVQGAAKIQDALAHQTAQTEQVESTNDSKATMSNKERSGESSLSDQQDERELEHRYDEARFGSQEKLLRDLQKANGRASLLALLESARAQHNAD